MEVRTGISGWRYPRWRGTFYPPGLPQRRELEYAASRLTTIEINGSFYSLQRPDSYRRWAAEVPVDFCFAVKGGRYLTHMLRLRGVEQPLATFWASGVLALGRRLGPVLWQLPPTMPFEPDVLDAFLRLLPRTHGDAAERSRGHDPRIADRALTTTDLPERPLRHAVEARHPSFSDPRFADLLRRHGVALVVADSAGRFPALDAVTTDLVYVRLHGDTELYTSGYDDAALDRWADRVRTWSSAADVLVYFDNDAKVHAPFDAQRLAARLGVGPDAG
ncbi:DUF72 domain-containing protein [Isoptericola sp. b441]|uniref:DUF72 domain-containing protein n=1 Tax=Actinotalea lenta TaxID=3064654 RepID=A0ABT9D7U9_9CELL|nr:MULTISPECIES: DUF72 domain-containing protein [unclassified Isoptericola]MDO8106935.1 DUF72 domain-containing protein [Isoptericola sp. b441]MDO8121355.1 DUF72 domain-containing protein [Isoptericola sp. b490]